MTIDGTVEKLTRFAVKQGVSRVILLVIIIGGIWLVPKHLTQIQQGYVEQRQAFETISSAQQKSFEASLQQLITSNEKEREIFLSLIRKNLADANEHRRGEPGT